MKKKAGLLFVALVLVLGSLGVAYAAWTDDIDIGGSVSTGSLCWKFVQCSALDELPPSDPGGDYVGFESPFADYGSDPGFVGTPPYWRVDKNVAWGDCEISEDGKTLTVTLYNAYPCYFNSFSFYVENCGTVPLKIDHVLVNGEDWKTQTFYKAFDINGDGANDLELKYQDNFGGQIEPGPGDFEFSFWLHVLQPAPQDSALTFTIDLVAVQWNEYPLPVPEE